MSALKVKLINSGQSPIVEPGLGELLAKGVAAGKLKATTDTEEAILGSSLTMICVGTPSKRNGDLDLRYVDQVCREIGAVLKTKAARHTVVVRSTVLPGTGKLSTWWKSRLAPVLDELAGDQVVVDCRSAAYAAAWKAPAARTVTVRVEQERSDGTRSVVSHHAKHTRGLVARTLCEFRGAGGAVDTVEQVHGALSERWAVELKEPTSRAAGVLTVVLAS